MNISSLSSNSKAKVVMWAGLCISILVPIAYFIAHKRNDVTEEATKYMQERNAEEAKMANKVSLASWGYESNFTDVNKEKMIAAQKESAEFERNEWKKFKKWQAKWPTFHDLNLRRQFEDYSIQGLSALPDTHFTELIGLQSSMPTTYSTAKVDLCATINGNVTCSLSLEPELTALFTKERNITLLTEAWEKWRDVSGAKIRKDYIRYIELSNEAARLNDFEDMGKMWLKPYESDDFKAELEHLWQQLKPLYEQIHAYVRRKLRLKYGADQIPEMSPIPAQLLGNMWAQTWSGIYDIVVPYPNKTVIDVTRSMEQQGYTPKKMFELAEQFFKDLNLTAMTPEFWERSIIEKPTDREMVCHASAWDFYDGKDFRIKMCTTVTMDDLVTIHHEMGHIQYYLQYKDQPQVFRAGANPGFHEAVGDSLALSVSTPRHLHKIGLSEAADQDREADINYLMKMALDKVVFLPFGYLIDRYRWDVFSGAIPKEKLNAGWWKLRNELQGIKAPVNRTEEHFDAGAKYHVVADVPYIRYFVSFIIQFQFHKAMCVKAGDQYRPHDSAFALHKCDIDKSHDSGNALASMLKLGSSRPWPDALEILTGSRKMDASVLREYFAPLERWLVEDNKKHGEKVGWNTEAH